MGKKLVWNVARGGFRAADDGLPDRGSLTPEQRRFLFCEPDEGLCQIVASNSGKNGNEVLKHTAAAELQRRKELHEALDLLRSASARRPDHA